MSPLNKWYYLKNNYLNNYMYISITFCISLLIQDQGYLISDKLREISRQCLFHNNSTVMELSYWYFPIWWHVLFRDRAIFIWGDGPVQTRTGHRLLLQIILVGSILFKNKLLLGQYFLLGGGFDLSDERKTKYKLISLYWFNLQR
jgi:hypothetical protein